MFRSKDFYLMDVVDIKGKRLGMIKDLILDFNKGVIEGFFISSYNPFQRNVLVLKNNIIYFDKELILKDIDKGEKLKFSQIKGMDVLDINGNIIGMIEDLIFDEKTFNINGVIVSLGYIENFIRGKRIILIKDLILGETNMLYFSECKVELKTVPHKLFQKDESNEKCF